MMRWALLHAKSSLPELIGRSSNLILVDSDGRITDCMRRMDFAGDAERSMMPGMFYRMPPKQNKLSVFDAAEDERRALIAQADRAAPMDKWLLSAFSGLSPLLCRELAHRCGGDYERLDSCISALLESIANGETAPYILTRDGAPFDYSCIAIGQYGSAAETDRFDSFSELLDNFYARRDRLERQRRRGSDLTNYVQHPARPHSEKACRAELEELRRADSREELKKQCGAGKGEHLPHEKGGQEP
ncbi:MAG: NFACT family protein [Oscillospiraceae bacterium]